VGEFELLRPWWLLALLPLPLLLWRIGHSQGGLGGWQRLCEPHLLEALRHGGQSAGSSGSRWRLQLPLALSWLLAVTALAGPAWERQQQPLLREGEARVILLDLSRSMDATDLTPSRIERARFKALELLRNNRDGQVGLIAFAGEAHVVAPLTEDAATVSNLLLPLSSDLMPQQGSRVDLAIGRALELLDGAGAQGGELLLIGDGANEAALAVAAGVKAAGRRLSVIAVGSEQGAPIRLNEGGFLKDSSGAIVVPGVDLALLQRLADSGGGVFTRLTADGSDLQLIESAGRRGELRQLEGEVAEQAWRDGGVWLLLPLIPLLLLAFRRGALLLLPLLVLAAAPVETLEAASWWLRDEQRGEQLIESDPAAALPLLEDPSWRGAAHYRAGDHEAALESWQGIEGADAAYNRGNALARLGRYQEAVAAYLSALEQQPDMADAAANLALVESLIEPPPEQQDSEQQQEQADSDADSEPGGQQEQNHQPGGGEQKQEPTAEESGQAGQNEQNSSGQPQNRDDGQQDGAAGEEQAESTPSGEEGGERRDRQQASNEEGGEDSALPQSAVDHEESSQADAEALREALASQREKSEEGAGQPAEGSEEATAPVSIETSESQRATEQWLRRIPDDPAGLLRQKFLLEHRLRRQRGEITENGGEPW
jgi:Ca-activated chloride channel family protein